MLIDRIEAAKNPTKHTLVALVENKPGVLNRVASLFRRRSFNIQSLSVGETHDPAISRMTIVVDASKTNAALVERNLYKLINVIDVQDLSNAPSVMREMALIKVRVDSATKRTEIKVLADLYNAKMVDMTNGTMMLELTGDEEKVDSILKALEEFGIVEVVRTGRIAMARG
jgi:acetolactate synthase-1/3 small subunit